MYAAFTQKNILCGDCKNSKCIPYGVEKYRKGLNEKNCSCRPSVISSKYPRDIGWILGQMKLSFFSVRNVVSKAQHDGKKMFNFPFGGWLPILYARTPGPILGS